MKIIKLLLFIIPIVAVSQNEKELEIDENKNIIVYCNSSKNTNLFFPSIISNGTLGSENFQFGFDKASGGKIGILRGVTGPESNLLVTCSNGDIYSFVIRYSANVLKFNYFINRENRIGNINNEELSDKREKIVPDSKIIDPISYNDFENSKKEDKSTDSYYSQICEDIINRGQFYKRFYAEATSVKLKLSNIVYNNKELYFYLVLDNSDSNIDYDINNLQFNIVAANPSKKTSTQKIKIEPLFVFSKNENVESGAAAEFVYVLKKFTINKEKKIEISLTEKTGERDLIIYVSNNFINNPNLF